MHSRGSGQLRDIGYDVMVFPDRCARQFRLEFRECEVATCNAAPECVPFNRRFREIPPISSKNSTTSKKIFENLSDPDFYRSRSIFIEALKGVFASRTR